MGEEGNDLGILSVGKETASNLGILSVEKCLLPRLHTVLINYST